MSLFQAFLSLIFQVYHTLYSAALRGAQAFRWSKSTARHSELPISFTPIQTSGQNVAFGEDERAKEPSLRNLGDQRPEKVRQDSVNSQRSWNSQNFHVPFVTLESGRQSRARRINHATQTSKRVSHKFFPSAESVASRGAAQMRSCDAVLDIIDSVIWTHSNLRPSSEPEITKQAYVPCPVIPISISSLPSLYSTPSTTDVSSLATPSQQSPEIPSVSTPDTQPSENNLASNNETEPVIGALGRRRGFKGAPIRVQGVSVSRKISPALLKPITIGSKEFLSAYPAAPPQSGDLDKSLLDDYMKANPFATKFADPFYATDVMTFDIPSANLYSFSVYRRPSQMKSDIKLNCKDFFYNQPTSIYDMSIYSYGIPSVQGSGPASLAFTFGRIPTSPLSDPSPGECKDPAFTSWQGSKQDAVISSPGTDMGTCSNSGTSANSSPPKPDSFDNATSHRKSTLEKYAPPEFQDHDAYPAIGQDHGLRPFILPELQKFKQTCGQASAEEVPDPRLEALEKIINLLHFDVVSTSGAMAGARTTQAEEVLERARSSIDIVDMYREVYAI